MTTKKELIEQAEKRVQKMVSMYNNGMTIIQIAEHYKISKQRVSELFRQHNVILRASIPDNEIARLKEPEKVAERFGIKYWTARNRLKKLGFVFPRRPTTKTTKWTKEIVSTWYSDYQSGMTEAEIAAKNGIHQTTVSAMFKRYGFEAVKRGWPLGKPRKHQ